MIVMTKKRQLAVGRMIVMETKFLTVKDFAARVMQQILLEDHIEVGVVHLLAVLDKL